MEKTLEFGKLLQRALVGLVFASTLSIAHADSPAMPSVFSKAVGADGQYVFVMLPGRMVNHRRKVQVPCDAYTAHRDASRQARAEKRQSAETPFCAAGEKMSGSSSRSSADGKLCEVNCSSRRWTVRSSRRSSQAEGYAESGLYPSGDSQSPLWTVQWYAFAVHLSRDGRYLARMGPWAGSASDLAVAFYDRGVLLKEYRVNDLVADPVSLPHSVSHFMWRREVKLDENNQQLLVATLNDELYVFDMTSGEAVVQKSAPEPSYAATVTNRDGKAFTLANVTVCGSTWMAFARLKIGRSASFSFYGFIVKDSTTLNKGTKARTLETLAVPFKHIRAINHIGEDANGENDLWLIEPRSGPSIRLSTEKASFGFCGDVGASAGEMIAAKEVKAIAFEKMKPDRKTN
jgi:hypothetical protein